MHPGDHVRLGDALEKIPGVRDGDSTCEQLLSLPVTRHEPTF
jgi:hypothetical protein